MPQGNGAPPCMAEAPPFTRRKRCPRLNCIRDRSTGYGVLFVERVLTNYWIYRSRMDRATPSLDAVASGFWPAYNEQHADPVDLAGKQR